MATVLISGSIDIEAIKDQYPLASVVEQHVALKRRSGLLEGLCPFHSERTPSFKIYESDQRYHCFGCGAHGDIFDFLRELKGLDIREAAAAITGGIAIAPMSPERIEELRAKRAAFEAEEAARRESATIAARERWIGADPNFSDHPYLDRKGIQPHGTRREGDLLLIPLIGDDGKIQTLQSIASDGRKLFVNDAPTSGGLFVLGGKVVDTDKPVLLCEGFATAASLQEATGYVTVCAFNSGNLTKVADRLAAKYPNKEYIVCGDDDRGKTRNVGREAAIEAAAILKCRAIFPEFPHGAEGSDFNDMAQAYGADAITDLIVNGVAPEDAAPNPAESTFDLLDLDELEALPPPTWLIEDMLPEHGLAIVYGDPGAGKSFIVLDMALRLAFGMDWHGTQAKQCGVLYIAGEGRHGLGKRVKGWRREHGLEGAQAPFLLLPVAVQFLDKEDRAKLCRTITSAVRRAGFDIGLTVIDTVSRSIAGHDENSQEAMSLFVNGCAEIQEYTGGAVAGVHHSGKDSARGMRGSTVLLGACDTSIKVTKDEQKRATIEVEKQKDAEEAEPILMKMKKVEWAQGMDKEESTLVPVKSNEKAEPTKTLSKQEADRIFEQIEKAWNEGHPWSPHPHAKRSGRYLPRMIADTFGVSMFTAEEHVRLWQQRDYLALETFNTRSGAKGLKVARYLERDDA